MSPETRRSPATVLAFRARWTVTNLRQRPGRTLLTIAGMALAVALLVSVTGFHHGYRRALARSIEQLGFEVLVTAKGCPYEATTLFLRGGNIPMYIDAATRDAVVSDPAVAAVTQLLLQTETTETGQHLVVLGVDERYRSMKPWLSLQMGEWLPSTGGDVVALGYNAATELDVAPGDLLRIPGRPGELRVVGILDRCGAQDDGTVFVPLATAQKLFDKKDSLTGLGLRLTDLAELPDFLVRMHALPGVQAIPLSQAQGAIINFVGSARRLLMAVGALTALVAALALASALLMSLLERRRELAILRALGARASFLFVSVLLEGAFLSIAASVGGVALAFFAGGLVEGYLRALMPFSPRGTLLAIEPSLVVLAFVSTVLVGLACSLYPAWRAASIRPLRAMRDAG